jgi:HEPN domain-containing protein
MRDCKLAPRPSQPDVPQHGLVSLWDMLQFHADRFVSIINHLFTIEHIIENDPADFWRSSGAYVAHRLEELEAQLRSLDLPVSAKKAADLQLMFRSETAMSALAKRYIEELRGRIEDELEGKQIFYMSDPQRFYSEPLRIFGYDINDKLPGVGEDLEEAAKCLALKQGTACVFHLMRAMEVAVRRVSEQIGINNTEREWGKLLSDVQDRVEAMEKGARRNEWSACHANLYHVKQAWRNSTMHPKNAYTPDQAEDVLRCVAAFMKHLSKLA